MLRRVKRKISKIIRGRTSSKSENTAKINPLNDGYVILKSNNNEQSLSAINDMIEKEDSIVSKRKITALKWNGPIMHIQGYYYLENIPILDEDHIKKKLILTDFSKSIEMPLRDKTMESIGVFDISNPIYSWAGFEGNFNFANINNGKPLPESTYHVYLWIEVNVPGKHKYQRLYPLGNISNLLNNGFHSAKMEYYSARREMKYNLLVTYDLDSKTMKIKSTKLKDFDPVEMGLDKRTRIGLTYRFFNKVIFPMLYKLFCLFPLKEKNVLFASDSRSDISGNFEFVYKEMVRRQLDLNYKFMLKSTIRERKSYGELISLAYNLATSKFIFLDDYFPIVYPLKIRKNAELIQLWHAVGAFKTFGYSRLGLPGGPSPRSKNHRNYTKAIVSSKNVAKFYAEGFGIPEENVVATGIPRTDVFFDQSYQKQIKENLYKEYPFLKNKKVILFAPTFRGNGQQSAYYPMEVLDLDKLYHRLKEEYVFILKIHPFVKNDISIPYEYSDFFYNFSGYREVNNLLFVTDLLITDYSSVCFEFALLNRPMLFFAFDVEDYVQKRDFYFDYHKFIPGPLVRTTDEIIEKIINHDFEMEKIKPFVKYFFDHTDGKSSARVVDELVLGLRKSE